MSINYMGILNGGLSIDKEGNASTTRIFVYHFNGGESPLDIISENEIPEIGEAHPSDSTYLATNISVSEPLEGDEKKSAKYEVTITYTRTAANIVRDQTQEPWKAKPYDLSIAPLEIVVPFIKAYKNGDKKGNPSEPVLNPAGDPYEEGVSIQHTLLRFSYNLQTFRDSWLDSYIDSVNKINTTVCDVSIQAGKGRLRNLAGSQQYIYNTDGSVKYKYWKVDIEIEIAKKVWKKEIMARGLFFLSGGKKYRIYTDNQGNFGKKDDMGDDAIPVDEPQKLDKNGALYTGSTAYYKTFYDKFYSNWASLALPKTVK